MKKLAYNILALLFTATTITSCTKDFAKYNLNPDAVTSIDPGALLSDALVKTSDQDMEPRTNYCHAFMQYGYTSFWSGTTYVESDGIGSRYWNNFYRPVLNNLEYVIPVLKTQPNLASTYAAARIWRVYVYQKLTDFYGDIPYSQAGKALTEHIYTPAYDPQQQIYTDLIKELRESITLLGANSTQTVKGDQFYAGNALQWKKLAASLLLRVGMRLIKVDPTQAATLAKEAVADGLMTSNSDMPVLKHSIALPNGFNFLLNDGVEHFFLHKTLVTHMQNSGDPRLQYYGAIYDKQISSGGTITSNTTSDYIGYSFTATDPAPNVRIRYDVFGTEATPFFDFPYAEVEFLQAEAVLRGYITGDANALYQAGITAHMQSLSLLPTSPTITSAQISAYLLQNPLSGTTEQQIAQVNTEFWVAGFAFDGDEVWANWRRTGYPALVPNPTSISQTIPRKMPYPQSEFTLNGANVNAAVANYGGQNTFNPKARVWWDK
ncbi:SusD/RagB family nutrient-binding outer membrane lipoprotein [Mucilaginibacter sp.]|uniref:SusD/RagB family nutrient-binding outer membrane lipoprotein n=1 Tax=Mucilaginibacter sp. TaxID=1882438 RepID=UPI003D129770